MKTPSKLPPPAPEEGSGRKRTIAITLLALGAGAVTIGAISGTGTGSRDRPKTYKDVASCEAEKIVPSDQCRQNFTQALSAHERSAPAFASRENCEREYGTGNCMTPSAASGRSSSFIPLMAGYLIAQRAAGSFQAAPLYRRPGDPEGEFRQSAAFPFATSSSSSSSSSGYRGSSGFWSSSSSSTTTSNSSSTTSRSPVSAPSAGITTTSRGGFGSSGHSSSGS